MSFLPFTEYETASQAVRSEYDDQIAKNCRITNMKRTLLHNVPAFHAYMEWYTLRDLIVPFTGERAFVLFCYAISTGSNCLICSTFFRRILIDGGTDPENPGLTEPESFLMEFGRAISTNPHGIPEKTYSELKARYTDEQIVLLISFAGIMYATNLFNTVAQIPLDEVLYNYLPKKEEE
ncbi:MAG: carboxymuconolactone decarboxylase family protein [Oscillospiraceae bacterium]